MGVVRQSRRRWEDAYPQQPDRLAVAIPGLYRRLSTLHRWGGWPLTPHQTGHDGPEWVGAMDRNRWARWTEIPIRIAIGLELKVMLADDRYLGVRVNFRFARFGTSVIAGCAGLLRRG